MLDATATTQRPVPRSSAPSAAAPWFGTKPKVALVRTDKSTMSASAARPGKCGNARMRVRLIDTATKRSPASAADAPASATKKFSHPAGTLELTRARLAHGTFWLRRMSKLAHDSRSHARIDRAQGRPFVLLTGVRDHLDARLPFGSRLGQERSATWLRDAHGGLGAFGPTLAACVLAARRGDVRSVFGKWRTNPAWIVGGLLLPLAVQLPATLIEVALGGHP